MSHGPPLGAPCRPCHLEVEVSGSLQLSWRWLLFINGPIGVLALPVIAAVVALVSIPARIRTVREPLHDEPLWRTGGRADGHGNG